MGISKIVHGLRDYLITRAFEKDADRIRAAERKEPDAPQERGDVTWDGESGSYKGDLDGTSRVEGQPDLLWDDKATERSDPDAAEIQLLYKGKTMVELGQWKDLRTGKVAVAVDTHRLDRTGLEDVYATFEEGKVAAEHWAANIGKPIFDRESAALAACPPRDPTKFFTPIVDQNGNPPWQAERPDENNIRNVVLRGSFEPTPEKEQSSDKQGLNAHLENFYSLAAQRGMEADRGPEQSGGLEL